VVPFEGLSKSNESTLRPKPVNRDLSWRCSVLQSFAPGSLAPYFGFRRQPPCRWPDWVGSASRRHDTGAPSLLYRPDAEWESPLMDLPFAFRDTLEAQATTAIPTEVSDRDDCLPWGSLPYSVFVARGSGWTMSQHSKPTRRRLQVFPTSWRFHPPRASRPYFRSVPLLGFCPTELCSSRAAVRRLRRRMPSGHQDSLSDFPC